jgi:hypothetical protein
MAASFDLAGFPRKNTDDRRIINPWKKRFKPQ